MGTHIAQRPKMLPMKHTVFTLICIVAVCISCMEQGDSELSAGLNGKAGSIARFGMTNTHLYSVDHKNLSVYRILANGALDKVNSIAVTDGVETIFPYDAKLFIGTINSMLTYDLSNPDQPIFLSAYSHVVACDPVVVQDSLAYVTLRATNCRPQALNVLDIINMKDPTKPVLLTSVQMSSPYGLGVDGNALFVCQGANGLDVYDISSRAKPILVKTYGDIHAFDVIPHNGTLIMTGNDGIAQYDYKKGPTEVKLLSTIAITK